MSNHEANHLSKQLVRAYQKKESLEGLNLLGEIEDLLQRTKRILTEAEDKKRYSLALDAIREARGVYELLSKIAFSLHQVRLTELELERERDGTAEQERREAYDGHLAILTDAELDLYEQLAIKIENQSTELVKLDRFLPDPPTTVTVELEEEEPELEEETEDPEPVQDEGPSMVRTKKPKDKYRVKPVEPTEIPGGGRGRYGDNISRRKLLRKVGTRRVDTGGGVWGSSFPTGGNS
ncbi:MAG: hypothetical protein RX318_07600 [bacterium]|nr:hypothetical protein [bacterium]